MYSEEIAITALQKGADVSDQYYATWWLGKMRSRHPETIGLLIQKLAFLKQSDATTDERGVGLNAIRSLGSLKALEAGNSLMELLQLDDLQVRAEAARSLGSIRQTAAVKALTSLLQDQSDTEPRDPLHEDMLRAVIKAIGMIGSDDHAATKAIQDFADHPQPLLRSASCCSLLRLTGDGVWAEPIKTLLHHDEPLVRRGAVLDLGASGWPDALEPIQTAAVENSLKLIALKSLIEEPVIQEQPSIHQLNESVLNAMDQLL